MNKSQSVTLKFAPTSDFATFGQSLIAYVKKVDLAGVPAFSIHAADGVTLGIEQSEQLAMLAARQLNLIPVVVQ